MTYIRRPNATGAYQARQVAVPQLIGGFPPAPTGVETTDSGTVYLSLTPSAVVDVHTTHDSDTVQLTLTPRTVLEAPTLHPPLTADFEEGVDGNVVPLTTGSPPFTSKVGTILYDEIGSDIWIATAAGWFEWLNIAPFDRIRFSITLQHPFNDPVNGEPGDAQEFTNLFVKDASGTITHEIFTGIVTNEVDGYELCTHTNGFGADPLRRSTTLVAPNDPFRVDIVVDKGRTKVDVELYLNPASTDPDEILNYTDVDVGTVNVNYVSFGRTGGEEAGTLLFNEVSFEEDIFTGYTDSATATLKLTPSAVETAQAVDSEIVPLKLLPSGTEEKQQYDAATALLTFVPSGSDIAQYVDAATAQLTLTPSGTEQHDLPGGTEYTDAAIVLFKLTPSGTELLAKEYLDAATALITLTPNGTDTAQFVDAVSVPLKLTPSGTDLLAKEYIDTAIVLLKFTPSAVFEHYGKPTPQGSTRGLMAMFVSMDSSTYVDSGTARLNLIPSATEERQIFDAATALLAFTPSATEAYGYTDSNQVRLNFTPSGTDERTQFDTAIAALKFTPFATDTAQHIDSGLALLNLLPSAADILLGVDTSTPVVVLTPSGSDQYVSGQNEDVGELYLRLTPITIAEIRYLFDTLLAATVYRNYDAIVIQVWSGSMSSHWFAIPLNRMWSANLWGTKWAASVAQRWITNYKGRG